MKLYSDRHSPDLLMIKQRQGISLAINVGRTRGTGKYTIESRDITLMHWPKFLEVCGTTQHQHTPAIHGKAIVQVPCVLNMSFILDKPRSLSHKLIKLNQQIKSNTHTHVRVYNIYIYAQFLHSYKTQVVMFIYYSRIAHPLQQYLFIFIHIYIWIEYIYINIWYTYILYI
jgi:hypothetical protein